LALTTVGALVILPGPARVLAIMAPGFSGLTAPDGTVVTARVEDGFLSVQGDTVTIVAGTAELV
jgi:F-type H+-transporting ATPase subunit epsilon